MSSSDRRTVQERVEPTVASVDDEGLELPAGRRLVVDVFFDEQRVWSAFSDGQASPGDGGRARVRWPGALRRFLDGTTRVTLREHLMGEVLLDREHQFGTSSDRVRVVDPGGRPLAVDKIGHLERPFESCDEATLGSLLDQVQEILRIIREECGVPAFIAYGALLGAVRSGKLIGHDNDIDLSYLSRHEHPFDVARESFQLQRAMRRHGFEIRRFSAADFKVCFPISDGTVQAVDIFGGFRCEGQLYVIPRLRVPLKRSDIVPSSEVTLEGRSLPAPADPAKFLEAAYGDDWRTPDPAWKPQPHPGARRRLDGWLRGLRAHRDYWEGFYGRAARAPAPEPSDFAHWVVDREPMPKHVVDVGSGAGVDARLIADAGHSVTGLDYAYSAVSHGNRIVNGADLPVAFRFFNLYELRQVLAVGALFAHSEQPVVLYARHVLDAVDDVGRENFWRLARMALSPGRRLYLEFSTGKRKNAANGRGKPFRRLLEPDLVVEEIENRGGTVQCREGAPPEPAPVRGGKLPTCRVVAQW